VKLRQARSVLGRERANLYKGGSFISKERKGEGESQNYPRKGYFQLRKRILEFLQGNRKKKRIKLFAQHEEEGGGSKILRKLLIVSQLGGEHALLEQEKREGATAERRRGRRGASSP